jgi:hypothetical protein
MSLQDAVRLGSQRPRWRTGPRGSGDRGLEVVELADLAGLKADDWQRDVVINTRSQRDDGRWAALDCGLIVPRQNGKGTVLEIVELDALFFDPTAKLILHSAHEMKTAFEAFLRLVDDIKAAPHLEEMVRRIRYANGEWGVDLHDGTRIKFVARSTGSGRGFSADLIIWDEAYNLPAKFVAAMLPTLSARPNPQVWYTSSAPLPEPTSDVLRKLCRRGRAGESDRFAYFEWAAAEDAALDDWDAIAEANPGLGIRLNEEIIQSELEMLPPEDFARERLGIWPDEEEAKDWIIPRAAWEACERERSEPSGEVVLATDVSPNRDWASIAWAARSNQRGVHVEVLEHRRGVRWLIPTLVEYQERTGSKVAIGVNSPAWSLKEDLDEARVGLRELSKAELAQASGSLFDAVMEDDLAHLGQPALNDAVANADRRNYDDAWLWSRRTSETDISPLVSVTMAHWIVKQRRRKPRIS